MRSNNELANFIDAANKQPTLQVILKETIEIATSWCAEADKNLLADKDVPSIEEFSKRWKKLIDEAVVLGIKAPDKVYPHHLSKLIAR